MVLDAHAEGVDQDAEENEPLKDIVVDERFDVDLNGRQESSDAVVAGVKPEEESQSCFIVAGKECPMDRPE